MLASTALRPEHRTRAVRQGPVSKTKALNRTGRKLPALDFETGLVSEFFGRVLVVTALATRVFPIPFEAKHLLLPLLSLPPPSEINKPSQRGDADVLRHMFFFVWCGILYKKKIV